MTFTTYIYTWILSTLMIYTAATINNKDIKHFVRSYIGKNEYRNQNEHSYKKVNQLMQTCLQIN